MNTTRHIRFFDVARSFEDSCWQFGTQWPEDLAENNADIPDLVYNLLAWVLYGDSGDEAVSDKKLSLSDTNNRHVMSIAQDVLHVVSNGRVKTPKHEKFTAG